MQIGADLDGFIGIRGDQPQLHAVRAQFFQTLLQISLGRVQIKVHLHAEGFRHALPFGRGSDAVGDHAHGGSRRAVEHFVAQFFPVNPVKQGFADVFIAQDGMGRVAAIALQLVDVLLQVGHAQRADLGQVGLTLIQRDEIAGYVHAVQLACLVQVQGGVLLLDYLIDDFIEVHVIFVPIIRVLHIAPADFRAGPARQDKGPGGEQRVGGQGIGITLFLGKRLGNGRIGGVRQLLGKVGISGLQGDLQHRVADGFHAQLLQGQLACAHRQAVLDAGDGGVLGAHGGIEHTLHGVNHVLSLHGIAVGILGVIPDGDGVHRAILADFGQSHRQIGLGIGVLIQAVQGIGEEEHSLAGQRIIYLGGIHGGDFTGNEPVQHLGVRFSRREGQDGCGQYKSQNSRQQTLHDKTFFLLILIIFIGDISDSLYIVAFDPDIRHIF